MSLCANKHEIVRSYRDFYRHALRAVQFSSPSRYTVKTHLRLAYRSNTATAFHPSKIANTLLFLKHAAEERGFEHRLLKGLLHVWWWQEQTSRQKREYDCLTIKRTLQETWTLVGHQTNFIKVLKVFPLCKRRHGTGSWIQLSTTST